MNSMMKFVQISNKSYIADGGSKFDLLKLILAVMIVMLHCNVLPAFLCPILRVAVPLFFMMSGYFFFDKIKNLDRPSSGAALKRYCLRILKLYLFWFIFLLPFTIHSHPGWFDAGAVNFIEHLTKGFFFSGTFNASWFLSAAVIGMCLVFVLSRYLNTTSVLIMGCICYLFCAADSNYYYLMVEIPAYKDLSSLCRFIFGMPYFSFIYSMVWISIGKFLAEHPIRINNYVLLLFISISFWALFLEADIVRNKQWQGDSNSYLSLIPLCPLIFISVAQNWRNPNYGPVFRKYSTMLYCMHISFVIVLKAYVSSPIYIFLITLFICFVISSIILFLEKKPYLSVLKYAH